jgi:glycosyltransferase involved in cell wall biosynthesis
MARSPIRIMYIDTCMEMAGGQYSLLTMLERLDRSRYVPFLYTPMGSGLSARSRELGIETHRLPFSSAHLDPRPTPRPFLWAEDALRSFVGIFFLAWSMARKNVDVVHANTFKAALIGSLACILARKPLVFHDRITIRHGILEKMVARLAAKIVVVSSALAAKHGEALRKKVTLIYNGVDTDYMAPGHVSREAETGGPGTVCYLGRLSWEKGVDRLIEAAELVVAKLPGTSFLIGGSPYTPDDSAYREKLIRLVESRGLARNVSLVGHVDDARAFIAKADVIVLPSRRESLGRVLLEAMALEKAVVAFAVDGPKEIITDGKDGLLVEPDNVEDLAEAIITMLKDREFARQAGKMGRETVISRFSAKTSVDRIAGVYDEIASPSSSEDDSAV